MEEIQTEEETISDGFVSIELLSKHDSILNSPRQIRSCNISQDLLQEYKTLQSILSSDPIFRRFSFSDVANMAIAEFLTNYYKISKIQKNNKDEETTE